MAALFMTCSLCMFLTMLFFASEICTQGCSIEKAGILSILSGFAGLSFKSSPMDASLPKSTCCCCCPVPIATAQGGVYKAIPDNESGPKTGEFFESKSLLKGELPVEVEVATEQKNVNEEQ